jgi:ABC-type phosphate/phosphonate transport system substrate-binding protein
MDEAVKKVAEGKAQAGFGGPDCLDPAMTGQLIPLAGTDPVPGWLCLSLKGDNYEVEEKLTQAFLRLGLENTEHKKVLEGLGYNGFAIPQEAGLKGLEEMAKGLKVPF